MYTVEEYGDYRVITPESDIGSSNAPQAKDFVKHLIAQGHRWIVVDLSSTDFLDSSALGVLVTAVKTARGEGGDVRLCGLTANVHQILKLTRLTRVFDIFPDRETAVK